MLFHSASLRVACIFAILTILTCIVTGCDLFYDEGARFADHVAIFAESFRSSPQDTAVYEYVPLYGSDQRISVGIGRIHWCPQPPCDNQGAATVRVERGKSGTGYRIPAAASVPAPLALEKRRGPIRVHMRKINGVVEIVGLD
jgi:hypothetical protein